MTTGRQSGTEIEGSADALPAVVAVVLNYNGLADTIQCVQSLKQTTYANLRIIIVDNASSDGSQASLPILFPEIPLIVQPYNTGYAGGNNAGIRVALEQEARYVLIVNNDVVVHPVFLSAMVEAAELRTRVGVVSGLVFYQSEPTRVFSAAGHFNRWLCAGMNKGGIWVPVERHQVERDVDYACGVLQLVRREVFDTVGLLDEKYFMYFEDLEFSRRVLTRFIMTYTPRAIAYHKSGGGRGWRSYTELYLYFYTRNRFWVFASEPMLYRIYVAAYAGLNAVAKTCFIMLNLAKDRRKAKKQLWALWGGFRDGLVRERRTQGVV